MKALDLTAMHTSYEAGRFKFWFPPAADEFDQDEEWMIVEYGDERRKLRVHDYAELYDVPGLYEALVYDTLGCASPRRVVGLLRMVLEDWPDAAADLRVLDLGAGNGVVAEYLRAFGVGHIVGLDLLPEAAKAAHRDRPQAYDDFVVADLTDLSATDEKKLVDAKLNALVTVAALGFGDIPPAAFARAFNFVADDGWIAMTIKEDFLDPADDTGFARLLRMMVSEGMIDIQAHHRYCHRHSLAGDQLFYIALAARKICDVPAEMVRRAEGVELAEEQAAPGYVATVLGG
jgi:predicted TPR repeat methyltransferase